MTKRSFEVIKRDNSVTNRTFTYSKGRVKLDFTLRTDIKQDLKDFLELLKAGVADVEAEIAKK